MKRGFSIIAALCLVLAFSGCQSLQPFAQRTREKIASARQFANGGLEAFQCGQLQRAKGFFARATEERPDDFRARANLARTLDQSGETSVAIIQMQQAVEQSGNDPEMLVELGAMYLRAGQFLPALRQAQSALAENHRLASAWKLKGRVSNQRGDLSASLAEFQKAAALDADNIDIQMEIVTTYRQLNQPLKALAAVENLLARHPVDAQPESAIIAKADLLQKLKQYPSAIATLRNASREQPSSLIVARLGQAQLAAGQVSDARSTLSRGRQQFGNRSAFESLEQQLSELPRGNDGLVAF